MVGDYNQRRVSDLKKCWGNGRPVRGLHFQINHPQCKLVRTICGEVFYAVVDIRRGSATYGRWYGLGDAANILAMLLLMDTGLATGLLWCCRRGICCGGEWGVIALNSNYEMKRREV